ncbi:MAG: Aldehyde Dehydrogenase [Candidatus Parvarchaeum acidophilus ARMAN-5_'5-way FS']|jgi:glyceraldehyde-3-phosphate dehydrogenase [NAD(P)+]|uniref:Aldehyde Dehydrogenase n=2 Tax=Parvarchaeum acidophilus TaxID=662761 RepID=D6GWB6_PARA5|nr:MAG: Aldehyde Dehydrogenase [Candidatus Parvarchaeum acidophilus ARMAN-5]EGD71882.1 MAG: Aldehyde Dehydrogenase [Candidatus Parvarchaeum acidophilus ARMAN-5_'5-way FS']
MEKLKLSEYFSNIYDNGEYPRFKVLIDGKWVKTKDTFDLVSSVDESKIAEIGSVSKEDLDLAVKSANDNKDKIRGMAAIDRLELINKIRKEIEAHKEEIVKALMMESGKAYGSANGEINAAIERLRLSMEDSRKIMGEYIPGDWSSDTTKKIALVIREPLGVVLGISPFNYPVYTSIAKIMPALLSGNSVIMKPPSSDPIAMLMCAEIFRKCGVPSGTLQVITGSGSIAGDYLIENKNINMISFTGSTSVGKHIAEVAGLKKIHLELGGKGTAIVLDDSDLDLAAKECVKGSLELAGQRCDAVSRVLVVENIAEKFYKKIEEHLNDYKFDNPLKNNDINMGPVINKKAAERIDSMVKDAVNNGAKLVKGGKFNNSYYEPTILEDVPLSAQIANEETFGPVITLIKVKDEDEAILIANKSNYGLDSAVFTNDFYRAWKIMKALQVGNITLNSAPSHGTAYFPFGGVKDSGAGKEGVGYSIEEMTNIKTMVFNLGAKDLGKPYSGQFKD